MGYWKSIAYELYVFGAQIYVSSNWLHSVSNNLCLTRYGLGQGWTSSKAQGPWLQGPRARSTQTWIREAGPMISTYSRLIGIDQHGHWPRNSSVLSHATASYSYIKCYVKGQLFSMYSKKPTLDLGDILHFPTYWQRICCKFEKTAYTLGSTQTRALLR